MPAGYVELPVGALGGKKLQSEQVTEAGNLVDKQVFRHHAGARVQKHYYNLAVAGTVAEALMSLTSVSAFVTGAPATAFVVPAGMTFWVTRIGVTVRQTASALNWAEVNLRVNPTGAATATSAIAVTKRIAAQAPSGAAGLGATVVISLPDPIEIPAGAGWGISHRAQAATCELSVSINGFEGA